MLKDDEKINSKSFDNVLRWMIERLKAMQTVEDVQKLIDELETVIKQK